MNKGKRTIFGSMLKKNVNRMALFLAILFVFSFSTYAWFAIVEKDLASYIPVASPQALYIGAGHVDIDNSGTVAGYEDIRYLYISGVDVTEEETYRDYLFCIYGKSVPKFEIQIGYTTNNQFTYEIREATENDSSGIEYTTHGSPAETYYYTVNDAIGGNYINKKTVNSEAIADPTKRSSTYGEYTTNVDTYADPIYWLSDKISTGVKRGGFVKYFVLRVYLNGKAVNDKETDIIVITAKST